MQPERGWPSKLCPNSTTTNLFDTCRLIVSKDGMVSGLRTKRMMMTHTVGHTNIIVPNIRHLHEPGTGKRSRATMTPDAERTKWSLPDLLRKNSLRIDLRALDDAEHGLNAFIRGSAPRRSPPAFVEWLCSKERHSKHVAALLKLLNLLRSACQPASAQIVVRESDDEVDVVSMPYRLSAAISLGL